MMTFALADNGILDERGTAAPCHKFIRTVFEAFKTRSDT